MKHLVISFLLIAFFTTSCTLFKDPFIFQEKTKEFIETIMQENYDQGISMMALDSEIGKKSNPDSLKLELINFKKSIVRNFGAGKFDYSFIKAEKKISTNPKDNTPPHTTLVIIEFSSENTLGLLQVLFDDKSTKIINLQTLDVKTTKPNMSTFWLSSIIPLSVLLFNIYVIRAIKRSNLTRKWLKYLTVGILNIPSISYAAVKGVSISFLNAQILLGVSFNATGYFGTFWTVGIPLGGIYWFWRLKSRQ